MMVGLVVSRSSPPSSSAKEGAWRELGEYADSLRESRDESGRPRIHFPDDYDEVVELMGRAELATSNGGAPPSSDDTESWATTTLRDGVRRCFVLHSDERSRAALSDDEDESAKIRAGLAKIEQLDRKLRQRQARARAVADRQSLEREEPRAPASPQASECSSVASGERFFVTDRARRRVPVEQGGSQSRRRRRRRDRDERPEEHEMRVAALLEEELSEAAASFAASDADRARLAAIDAKLRDMGVDSDRLDPPAATGDDLALFSAPPDPGSSDDDDDDKASSVSGAWDKDDPLKRLRQVREARARQVDLDKRLASARDAPLVVLDDDEVEEYEREHGARALAPPCAADVAALVRTLRADKPLPTGDPAEMARLRARVDALADQMRDTINTAAYVRDKRRRSRSEQRKQQQLASSSSSSLFLSPGSPVAVLRQQSTTPMLAAATTTTSSGERPVSAPSLLHEEEEDDDILPRPPLSARRPNETSTKDVNKELPRARPCQGHRRRRRRREGRAAAAVDSGGGHLAADPAKSLAALSEALREASLRTTTALVQADSALRRCDPLVGPSS